VGLSPYGGGRVFIMAMSRPWAGFEREQVIFLLD
jgi:hypothetical protein